MRSTRMFEIIQLLRRTKNPLTAQQIADQLEVTKRTIYRDIASLQGMRVPIEGEAGIGYILRPGYDLPSINFDIEEAEAISVALNMIPRTGDKGLEKAAFRAMGKLAEAMKMSETLHVSGWGAQAPEFVDLSVIRKAIREENKIEFIYCDNDGEITERVIQPIALIYYHASVVVAAWCELRQDFRHFRPDRVVSCAVLGDKFNGEGQNLRAKWAAQRGTEF